MNAGRGSDLERLLTLWRQLHPKAATGGWWALSGFSYQAATFLTHFFQRTDRQEVEPGQLAQMERLSDIVCPADGRLRMIQVKKTLDLAAIRSALREAYLLTALCREHLPDLLPHLCFQIGCQRRSTPSDPWDVDMSDVLPHGDASIWDDMIGRFDRQTPILEGRDPLDELSLVLWLDGVRDTAGLIERLLGRLLTSFLASSPDEDRRVGRDLWSLYVGAERRKDWSDTGRILTVRHVVEVPDAPDTERVVVGQSPKLEHLRHGLFRDRPDVMRAVERALDLWFAGRDATTADGKVPVFWITGRSGEGKSVLLLQLVSRLLRGSTGPPILQSTPQQVPGLLSRASRWPPDSALGTAPLVAVDDLYDLRDREGWDDTAREACAVATPLVGLLTCGPTEQFEEFSSRLPEVFEVTPFRLPHLAAAELDEFLAWYAERTGRSRASVAVTRDNALLVQVMFELAQGMRMPEFAQRFKRRLSRSGVFEVARTIVAATALYLDAPLSLAASPATRDALRRLSQDDQLHFRVEDGPRGGLRLAHAHLAWLLFQEWVQPPETLESALARELHRVMEARASDGFESPFSPIRSLLSTPHVGRPDAAATVRIAKREQVLRELYELHLAAHGGTMESRAVPRWLEVESVMGRGCLEPRPSLAVVQAIEQNTVAETVHGSVAGWLWRLGQQAPIDEGPALKAAARRLALGWPNRSGLGAAVGRILGISPHDHAATLLALDWLDVNSKHPQAAQVLRPLVARSPSNVVYQRRALDWLEANPAHPQVDHMLAPLVAGNPSNAEFQRRALDWLDADPTHPMAYRMLMPLVAGSPANAELERRALAWLDANPAHLQAYQMLAPLVAGNPSDAELQRRAAAWVDANPAHPQAYQMLVPLVAGSPSDAELERRALAWLDANPAHPQAYHVLVPLVAGSPSDAELRRRAAAWLDANPGHPQAQELIKSLVAGNPTDVQIQDRAILWLDANQAHPQAGEVIRGLAAANPSDSDVKDRARRWLDYFEHAGPQAAYSGLLRTLIARSGGEPEWVSRGLAYVQGQDSSHRAEVLAVLLTTGHAASHYVDLTLDCVENRQEAGRRRFLLSNLSRALVGNPSAAATYLRGPAAAWRKSQVRVAVASGLNRQADSEMALRCLEVLEHDVPDEMASILEKLIGLNPTGASVDAFLARWLSTHFRRRGYGIVVGVLTTRPALLARVQALATVALEFRDAAIRADGSTISSAVRVTATGPQDPGLPKAGQRVEATLLEERTKKGGWKARHPASGLVGPIQNSALVPAQHQAGDQVALVVRAVNRHSIAFAW